MAGSGVVPASEHGVAGLADKEDAVAGGATDLFAPCTMDDILQNGTLGAVIPENFQRDSDYYEFTLKSRGELYLIPTATRMLATVRIMKNDGSPLSKAEALSCAPISKINSKKIFKHVKFS